MSVVVAHICHSLSVHGVLSKGLLSDPEGCNMVRLQYPHSTLAMRAPHGFHHLLGGWGLFWPSWHLANSPTHPPTHIRKRFLRGKMKLLWVAGKRGSI